MATTRRDAQWRRMKRGEVSSDEDSDEDLDEEDGDEESEEEEAPRRPAPGSLPPNSSDEDSESEDDDSDLLAMMAPREKKPTEPSADEVLAQKSKKQLAAEMEKLRLVRERRAAQAKARIEADGGVDRYAVGAGGGAKKDADDSDDDSDDDSENDSD